MAEANQSGVQNHLFVLQAPESLAQGLLTSLDDSIDIIGLK